MKKLIKFKAVLILKLFVFGSLHSQSIESRLILKEGNNSYKKGDFENSSNSYNNSIAEDQDNIDAIYNNGNSSMMTGDFQIARENFNHFISKSKSDEDKSKAHYNIGNSFLTQYAKEAKEGGQPSSEYLENAVNEYKKSLRYSPNDSDTRYNLSYALKMMQNQENKDQKNKDKDKENKDQENKDQKKKNQENKDQENKDQEKKNQEKKDQEKKDQENKDQEKKNQEKKDQEKKEQEKKEPKEKKPNESKEQAIKNLDAINGDEEKVLLKVNRKKGNEKKKSKTKDW